MDVLDAYYVFVYLFIYATQVDSWELWNSFRMLCEHHSQLSIALDVLWVKVYDLLYFCQATFQDVEPDYQFLFSVFIVFACSLGVHYLQQTHLVVGLESLLEPPLLIPM